MFDVQILGIASATPVYGRHLSAQVVRHNDRLFLVDCGEGTQFQLLKFHAKLRRLDAIFISHLHGDHIFGLPGLITSLNLNGRTAALRVVGPVGLKKILWHLFNSTEVALNFELLFTEVHSPDVFEPVFENEGLCVHPLPLDHRMPCIGFLFSEKPKRRRFRVEEAQRLSVPPEYYTLLRNGNAITLKDGRRIVPDQVLGDAPPASVYAYCSDTAYKPALVPLIANADLLYHEATFLNGAGNRAAETHHSTAAQAAAIARDAEVGRLVIGHFSARYFDLEPFLEEARPIFPETHLAEEGKIFTINR